VVASREHELRVGELRARHVALRIELAKIGDGRRILLAKRAQEILGLVLELTRSGRAGRRRAGMTSLLERVPGVRLRRAKGGSREPFCAMSCSGGLGPSRGREASCAPKRKLLQARQSGQLRIRLPGVYLKSRSVEDPPQDDENEDGAKTATTQLLCSISRSDSAQEFAHDAPR